MRRLSAAYMKPATIANGGLMAIGTLANFLVTITLAHRLDVNAFATFAVLYALFLFSSAGFGRSNSVPVLRHMADTATLSRGAFFSLLRHSTRLALASSFLIVVLVVGISLVSAWLRFDIWHLLLLALATSAFLFNQANESIIWGSGRNVLAHAGSTVVFPTFFLISILVTSDAGGLELDQVILLLLLGQASAIAFSSTWLIFHRKTIFTRPNDGKIERQTFHLTLSTLSTSLLEQIDILILSIVASASVTGQFRMAVALANILNFGAVIAQKVFSADIARAAKVVDRARLREALVHAGTSALAISLLATAVIAVSVVLFGDQLIPAAYASVIPVTLLLIAASLLTAFLAVYANALQLMGRSKDVLTAYSWGLLVRLTGVLLLVPFLAVWGAALSRAASLIFVRLRLKSIFDTSVSSSMDRKVGELRQGR